MKKKIGRRLEGLFPDANIYLPYGEKKNYALAIGPNLIFSEAKDLQERAIKMGFREDTFLWRAERAYFEY